MFCATANQFVQFLHKLKLFTTRHSNYTTHNDLVLLAVRSIQIVYTWCALHYWKYFPLGKHLKSIRCHDHWSLTLTWRFYLYKSHNRKNDTLSSLNNSPEQWWPGPVITVQDWVEDPFPRIILLRLIQMLIIVLIAWWLMRTPRRTLNALMH